MLQIKDIRYSIGDREILSGITIPIESGKNYILMGNNGSGKTTFFRILAGELEPDSGSVTKPGNYKIGYLPQEVINQDDTSVLQLVIRGRSEVSVIWSEIEKIHSLLKNAPVKGHKQLMNRLEILEQQFESLEGYKLEFKAKSILSGLGFLQKDLDRPVSEFSGGWRMRAYLAMLLIREPDLILLDEPTNHLDIPSMEWLEQYLSSFPGSVILVTHDRFFIDRIGGSIIELESGKFIRYKGKYNDYERAKRERFLNLLKKQREQDRELARQERFIERFRYKNTKASLVQSRIKALKKINRIELPEDTSDISFKIESGVRSYRDVLNIEKMSFGYEEDNIILKDIDLKIFRGEKSALIGKNGSGKTTLTKLITGHLSPLSGEIVQGEKVITGYYAQHQIEVLNPGNSILDEVSETVAKKLIPRIRDILGIFQFRGDDVHKKIRVLSGGEKARVSLAKILLSPANFLIMDEPTTHLDKIAREALQNALSMYDGTLLLISHDRYFIDNIVDKIILLKEGHLSQYPGNYSYFFSKFAGHLKDGNGTEKTEPEKTKLRKGKKSREQKRAEAESRQAVSSRLNKLKKRISDLEKEIEILELSVKELEGKLSLPETYNDSSLTVSLQKEFHIKKSALEKAYSQWEENHMEIEEIKSSIIGQT